MNKKGLTCHFAAWKRFMQENVNPAALRLLFQKQSVSDIRAALDWEKEHR